MSERSGFAYLFCRANTDERSPHGARGLAAVGWPFGRLTSHLRTTITPNLCRISKNSITKNCRATRDIQLCLNELGLIRAGFQIAKLQSMVHKTVNQFLDLENFLNLKIASSLFLGAVFEHVRHWISSWPLNKVCSPCHGLQLSFRSHSHASSLSYCSTLVKLASCKRHFKGNQHLEANLG